MSGSLLHRFLGPFRVLPLQKSFVHNIHQPVVFANRSAAVHTSPLILRQVEEEEIVGRGDKVLKVRLGSTRLDAVIKAGLNISRNKIEKSFYDDRIRVNGSRPKKKSSVLAEGDEVDIVRGINKLNPLFIDVSRIELLEIGHPSDTSSSYEDNESSGDEDETRIPLTLKRYKFLTIQNYPVPWKGSTSTT